MTKLHEKYRKYADKNRLYSGRGYAVLDHRCQQIFRHVDGLQGKTLLEVGGGEGLFTLWALANGAARVIILEPEASGSRSGVAKRLERHRLALRIPEDRLRLYRVPLQDFEGEEKSFDLVFSYSSINHLDEFACTSLTSSYGARKRYLSVFRKVNELLRDGGHFIISDSGRLNFWNFFRLKSPFAPTIEWCKHQEPFIWKSLLYTAGFEFGGLEWLRFYLLRRLGAIGVNSVVARATTSQFILTMRKS